MDFYFLRPPVLSNMHQKYLFLVSIAKDGGQKNIQIYTSIFSINQEDVSHELCVFSYTCRPIFLSLLPHILSSSIMALFLFSHGLSISPVHLYLSQVKSVHLYLSQVKSSNNKSLSLSPVHGEATLLLPSSSMMWARLLDGVAPRQRAQIWALCV
jgi:hypothetical protein